MPKGAKKGSGKDAASTGVFIRVNGKLVRKETVTQSVTQEKNSFGKDPHRLEIDSTHIDDANDNIADNVSNENEINSNDDVSEYFDHEGENESDKIQSIESDNEIYGAMKYNENDASDLEKKVENDEVPESDEIEVINIDSEDKNINSNKGNNTRKEAKLPIKRKCNFEENLSEKKTKPFECKESSPEDFEQSDSNNYTSDATPNNNSHFLATPMPFKTPVSVQRLDNLTGPLKVMDNEDERSSSFKKTLFEVKLAKLRAEKAMKVKQKETTIASPQHSSSQGREPEMTPARLTLKKVDANIKRCRQVISQLKDVFIRNDSLTNNFRVQAWRKELEDVEAKLTFPKTIIAVVGDTGEGKSSLMNALLDNRSMLPTSGIKACTATVVEVIQNTESNDLEADIEFHQREEWFDELRKLLNDLTNLDGKVMTRPPDKTSDAYVSYCKICAVYGEIDTFEVLSRNKKITCLLGGKKTIKETNSEEFRQSVEKYIETQDPGAGGQYWPIVKHVALKLPNCDVCSSGAALVDLPGVRDSNAARDKIAREYLKNCTAVWVVSSIHRAIDNKTAKELLGGNFRRQLFLDGQYGSIAFICTKTDDVNPSEIIRNLKLEAKTRELKASVEKMEECKKKLDHSVTQCMKKLQPLNKNLNTLKGEVKELRELLSLADHIDVDSEQTKDREDMKEFQDDLKDKIGQIETVEGQIAVLETKKTGYTQELLELKETLNIQCTAISAICAKERNEYSKTMIKSDFKAGLMEIKHRAGIMDTNADDDEDYDSDNDDDDHGSTADNLQVFCCSSTEYQKMRNVLAYDRPPQVFSCVEDTQIPALRNYVHEMTSKRRQQYVERLIRSLGRFVFDLQSYTADGQSMCDIQLNSNYSIDAKFDADLALVKDNLSLEIEKVFGSIRQKMEDGATNAANEAINTCAIWGAPVNNDNKRDRKTGGIKAHTYKATVKRQGTFTSTTFGHIDFNEQLTEPMFRSMIVIWDNFFREKKDDNNTSGKLSKLLDKLKDQILQKLKELTTSLCEQLKSQGVPRNLADNKGDQLHRSATSKLDEKVRTLKDSIKNRKKDIWRIVTPHIKTELQETYDTCAAQCGSGMFVKIKDHMKKGIDEKRLTMFDKAKQQFKVKLDKLQDEINKFTPDVGKILIQDIIATFEPLHSSNMQALRSAFLQPVTVACTEVREIYRQAGLENTEESNPLVVVAAGPTAGSSSSDPLAVIAAGPTAGSSSSDPLAVVAPGPTAGSSSSDPLVAEAAGPTAGSS